MALDELRKNYQKVTPPQHLVSTKTTKGRSFPVSEYDRSNSK